MRVSVFLLAAVFFDTGSQAIDLQGMDEEQVLVQMQNDVDPIVTPALMTGVGYVGGRVMDKMKGKLDDYVDDKIDATGSYIKRKLVSENQRPASPPNPLNRQIKKVLDAADELKRASE